MITQKVINIYRVKHIGLIDDGELVLATSIQDAYDKFCGYHREDYDIRSDGITSVTLEYSLEVICDE